MARVAVYGQTRLDIHDDALTVDDIKASMAEIFSELSNATAKVVGNEIHFEVKAGTKGMARVAVYGQTRLDIHDDTLSVEDIKASMAEIFSELSNATAKVVGNEIHFEVKAGTKGLRVAVYGQTRLDIHDDALSVDDVKASMAEIFSELSNATAKVVGNEIHFEVKAGTKGMARVAVYGQTRLDIHDDALSVDDIKASMAEIFSELSNATAKVVGNEIHFEVKAGTKGARVAVYGQTRLDIHDDALTPEEIKVSMAEIFSELSNSTFKVVGNEVIFEVKAGTKGTVCVRVSLI